MNYVHYKEKGDEVMFNDKLKEYRLNITNHELTKNNIKSIETKLGTLKGRDCIYLDKVYKKDYTYVFEGEINGRLLDCKVEKFIKYKLEFENVISMFTCDLDTYDSINLNSIYSFEEVEDSDYITLLSVNEDIDLNILKHYRLRTYDEVFDIIAEDYILELE